MTYEQFMKKTVEMSKSLEGKIQEECSRLAKCGGVDLEAHPDDYILPRIIITVALENLSGTYLPDKPKYKRAVRNLRHF